MRLDAADVLRDAGADHAWHPCRPRRLVALQHVVPAAVVVPELLAERVVADAEDESAVVLQEVAPQQEGEAVGEAVVGAGDVGGGRLRERGSRSEEGLRPKGLPWNKQELRDSSRRMLSSFTTKTL